MKKTIIWLVIAAVLILLGGALFITAMVGYDWDFSKLSTQKYETNTHNISEEFNSISIKTDTADILFYLSENDKCYVECYEEENANHSAIVKDGTLVIEVNNEKSWHNYIGINFDTPIITVYLPETQYSSLIIDASTGNISLPDGFSFENIDITLSTGDVSCNADIADSLKIIASTGDMLLEGMNAGVVDISVSTGDIIISDLIATGNINANVSTGKVVLENVSGVSLISNGTTGSIWLKNVVATGKFDIERSTGDVIFDGADAGEIYIETSTGDIMGNLLSEKVFIVETSDGDENVPDSITGGRCEIITSTGDINITIGE